MHLLAVLLAVVLQYHIFSYFTELSIFLTSRLSRTPYRQCLGKVNTRFLHVAAKLAVVVP